jgi:AcrR family transcriptional regulator
MELKIPKWRTKRDQKRAALRDQLARIVFDSGVRGLTSQEVADRAGLSATSVCRMLGVLRADKRVAQAPKKKNAGGYESPMYVAPHLLEQHKARRKGAGRTAERREDQARIRAEIVKLIDEAGIPGITANTISAQLALSITRVRAFLVSMRLDGEIVQGRLNRGIADDGARWVMPGRRLRNLDYWETQTREKVDKPPSPETVKRMAAKERELDRWADAWLQKRPAIVGAGQWKAEPVKAPRSVFEMVGQV